MSSKNYFINNPDNSIPGGITSTILKESDALSFHMKQKAYSPTPLVSLPALAAKYGIGEIYIKDESFRLGLNAFKGVGAFYAIDKILKSDSDIETLCTATDGNHGKAVAWSARQLGKKAIVIVPGDISEERVRAIEDEGAKVERITGNYDEACEFASLKSNKKGWALVQDTAFEEYKEIPAHIMAGYLTLFEEMEDTIHALNSPGLDLVFLQAGVGSFAATGVWYYLNRYGKMRPKIVIVEPIEADALFYSFEMGKLSTSPGKNKTIMAGLNCGTPSSSAWDIIKEGADISIKIDDSFAEKAIRELYFPSEGDKKILSGESGASGLAGFLAIIGSEEYKALNQELNIGRDTKILFINTEGPTDINIFDRIIS